MKKILRTILTALGLFFISLNYNKIYYRYDYNNAFLRTFFSILEATVWADNFKEGNFSKIKLGMTKYEVDQIMGRPLNEHCGESRCMLSYTRQMDSVSSFDRRDIYFDNNMIVSNIIREFWID